MIGIQAETESSDVLACYCKKILQQLMKYSAIQRENVN